MGTPYTLFLGRNMYQTFMNAYTLVDSQTRRKLDEMLKTWKEPVPGSLDTRPVFSPDITRNIESALIKARTAALQHQQARGPDMPRGRGSVTPTGWTNNPTPPQNMAPHPPSGQHYANNGPAYAHTAVSGFDSVPKLKLTPASDTAAGSTAGCHPGFFEQGLGCVDRGCTERVRQ